MTQPTTHHPRHRKAHKPATPDPVATPQATTETAPPAPAVHPDIANSLPPDAPSNPQPGLHDQVPTPAPEENHPENPPKSDAPAGIVQVTTRKERENYGLPLDPNWVSQTMPLKAFGTVRTLLLFTVVPVYGHNIGAVRVFSPNRQAVTPVYEADQANNAFGIAAGHNDHLKGSAERTPPDEYNAQFPQPRRG